MMKSTTGGSSTLVEYFEKSIFRGPEPTTLNDIVTTKHTGDEVTVADDLVGVTVVSVYDSEKKFQKFLLYAKDDNKYANPGTKGQNQRDYMASSGVFAGPYDQSNWVALDFGEVIYSLDDLANLKGHVIAGGTIKGTYVDELNPIMAMRPPIRPTSMSCPASAMLTLPRAAPTSLCSPSPRNTAWCSGPTMTRPPTPSMCRPRKMTTTAGT